MRHLVLVLGGVVMLGACAAAPGRDSAVDDTAGMGVPQHRDLVAGKGR